MRFYCQNCVIVSEELLQLVPNRQRSIPVLKLSQENEKLKAEVSQREYLIKEYKESRKDLLNTIEEQKVQLYDLKRNLNSDPAFHTLEYIEKKLEKKLANVEDRILNAVSKE